MLPHVAGAAVDSLLLVGDVPESSESATESAPPPPPKSTLKPVPLTIQGAFESARPSAAPKAVIVEKKTVVVEKTAEKPPESKAMAADFLGLMGDRKDGRKAKVMPRPTGLNTDVPALQMAPPPEAAAPPRAIPEPPPEPDIIAHNAPRDMPPPPPTLKELEEFGLPPARPDAVSATAVTAPVIGGYKVGPGDKLRLSIYGEKDLSNVYLVDGNGMISLPLIGTHKVAGLTLAEIEDGLKAALSNGYLLEPSVAVEVAEYRPFYIMGEVRRPGSYNYIEGMNVLNAVAIGGGFTYRAKTSEVEVVRDGTAYDDPLEVRPDFAVMPGDIITINERFF